MALKNTVFELGFVQLDGRRKQPLFRQLYDSLRMAILDGVLSAGTRIPSSRELVRQLGVSRTTVVTAVDQLIAEGYLKTVIGSGTFVSQEIPNESPFVNSVPIQTQPSHPQVQLDTDSYVSKEGSRLVSAMRDVALFADPGQIKPFRPGVPALDEFPISVWTQICRKQWSRIRPSDISYGEPAGYFPLREAIAKYLMAHRGVRCTVDQVMIVSGTQQAIELVSRLCVDRGDKILFENPGYPSARAVFRSRGVEIVPMPIDQHGAVIENAIKQCPKARLAYVTPSHQYPMGVPLSIERRLELIKWAQRRDALILEDDYDSEYRYAQKPIPAMQGLDVSHRTLYVGSFSKVIFPALSLGYVIVPPALIEIFEKTLSLVSRPPAMIDQYVLTDFIRDGHFGRHLRRMRKTHGLRRATFVEEIERHLGHVLAINGSEAGLHCATILKKKGMSDKNAAAKLNEQGIISRPLSEYYFHEKESPSKKPKQLEGLVFGFASSTPKQIKSAVRKMAGILG